MDAELKVSPKQGRSRSCRYTGAILLAALIFYPLAYAPYLRFAYGPGWPHFLEGALVSYDESFGAPARTIWCSHLSNGVSTIRS
jgi:hypothetical protein